MEGRLWKEIDRLAPTLWKDSTVSELEELKNNIDTLIRRKKEAPKDVTAQIAAVSQSYSAIDFGDSWSDAKTLSAVTQVDQLNFSPVVGAVLDLERGTSQWESAVELSKVLSRILFNAEGYAEKYVNGEMGHFCPRTASLVLEMWRSIVENTQDNSVDVKVFEKAVNLHPYCLGSYGDLSFISSCVRFVKS